MIGHGLPASVYGPEKDLLIAHLQTIEPGATTTYEHMDKITGLNIREHRHILTAARKKLLADKQMVFGVVSGAGLKRLDSEGIVNVGQTVIKKISRTSKRAMTTVAAANYDELSDVSKVKCVVSMTVLNLVSKTATKKVQNALADGITKATPKMIPMSDTLALLSK